MGESISDVLAALRAAIDHLGEMAPSKGVWSPPGRREGECQATSEKLRWADVDAQLKGGIAGRRVLVVGPGADWNAAAFADRGAQDVIHVGSPDEIAPEWSMFEIVYCDGLLHRVTEPLSLVRVLRSMAAPGGTLVIGSMILSDPERSEYLRFIPDRYAGDPTWWFLPGRLAFRWLVQTAGFEVEAEFGEREGPRGALPVASVYLRAVAL